MGTIYLRYCWPRWRPISRFTLCHQRMRFCAGTLLSLLRPNGEMHIGLYSEAARQVPDALHGRVADADLLGQHPCAPVCCVLGLLLGRPRHDREPHFGTDRLLARAWPLAPILEQALDAAAHVGLLPAPNRRLRYLSLALDGIRANPQPDSSTMRARATIFCGVLPSATSRSSVVRSLGLTYRHASMFRMPPLNLICRPLGIL